MDAQQIREELMQIKNEFLADYKAASEKSWREHLTKYNNGYLRPSYGRFFTSEERDAFDVRAKQYRSKAEIILAEAKQENEGGINAVSRRMIFFAEIIQAFSLMNVTEAESGRWSGNYPAYVDHLLEISFPVS